MSQAAAGACNGVAAMQEQRSASGRLRRERANEHEAVKR